MRPAPIYGELALQATFDKIDALHDELRALPDYCAHECIKCHGQPEDCVDTSCPMFSLRPPRG